MTKGKLLVIACGAFVLMSSAYFRQERELNALQHRFNIVSYDLQIKTDEATSWYRCKDKWDDLLFLLRNYEKGHQTIEYLPPLGLEAPAAAEFQPSSGIKVGKGYFYPADCTK